MSGENILITGGSGYIGSSLRERLKNLGHNVAVVDTANTANVSMGRYAEIDGSISRYQDLEPSWLKNFSTIVHLAAHSSVKACEEDPDGAVQNNAHDVIKFVRKLTKNQKFVFASTGSLYDSERTRRVYDSSKRMAEVALQDTFLFERSADEFYENYDIDNLYLLRFATVAGVSPVMRTDTILNGMTRDAVKKGIITIKNPQVNRPVLTLYHLTEWIIDIVKGHEIGGIEQKPLATWNDTVFGWALRIAVPAEARIEFAECDTTYDFVMPTEDDGEPSVSGVIHELIEHWRNSKE